MCETTARLARRVHAEVNLRAAQAALGVEAEERRAQAARVASLEEKMARVPLVNDKVEEERFRSYLGVTARDYHWPGRQSSPASFSKSCSIDLYDANLRGRHQRDRASTYLALLLLCRVSLISYVNVHGCTRMHVCQYNMNKVALLLQIPTSIK